VHSTLVVVCHAVVLQTAISDPELSAAVGVKSYTAKFMPPIVTCVADDSTEFIALNWNETTGASHVNVRCRVPTMAETVTWMLCLFPEPRGVPHCTAVLESH
jgi:hypothetical protein